MVDTARFEVSNLQLAKSRTGNIDPRVNSVVFVPHGLGNSRSNPSDFTGAVPAFQQIILLPKAKLGVFT
jgi:hypothetical protein